MRDVAEVRDHDKINEDVAEEGLALFGVDALGLDKVDRAILEVLVRAASTATPSGSPRSRTPAARRPRPIEEAYEPYLMREGLLTARRADASRRSARSRTSASRAAAGCSRAQAP